MRYTKIICTIGPASESSNALERLIRSGMDVARLNLSHGSIEEHRERIQAVRAAAVAVGRPVAIMLDIQGPKIRIGEVPGGAISLTEGESLSFCVSPELASERCLTVSYPQLLEAVRSGTTIYLDDGLIELAVETVRDGRIETKVLVGGELRSRKGVSLPGIAVDLPAITVADTEHIRFGVQEGVDYIAASFVRRAEHVEEVKRLIAAHGGTQRVVAKVENAEGLEHIDEIVGAADAVMVARGDMGVELPPEDVPLAQKRIIAKCNERGKPVITATQMLDSMVRNPRPTRAEATDVANAIFDGTDAVMLSGETAVGEYPVKAVQVMDRIVRRTEQAVDYRQLLASRRHAVGGSISEAIARATCETVQDIAATAILCSTQSGASARHVAKYRPKATILALTPNAEVVGHLCLVWGVRPLLVPKTENIDEMIDAALLVAREHELLSSGDIVAIVAGVRTGMPGATNLLQVQRVPGGDDSRPEIES